MVSESELFEEGYTGAFLKFDSQASKERIYDSLQDKKGFSYLSFKTSQETGTENRLEKTEVAVYIIAAMSFLIGFVIVYNMSIINLKERKRIFVIMMSLGMSIQEIGLATFAELFMQYVVSLFIGSIIGRFLGNILLQMSSTDLIQYPKMFSIQGFLVVALVIGAFMVMGHLLALRQIAKVEIVKELRSKEE
ncbi:MAG: ABC transporter permease [Eubacteriales bacterium]|nr:ABC transporter permease [Eubacteriales bacterium]